MGEVLRSAVNDPVFLIFFITVAGYLLGRIEIRGVGLGTAGVFLAALLFGHLGYSDGSFLHRIGFLTVTEETLGHAMGTMQTLGLLCFVSSVGFIAGPNFFSNLVRNMRSYALLAFVIIVSAALVCVAVICLTELDSAMAVGILSGALTTTPGFAAAQDVVRADPFLLDEVTVGHAVGYPFGVVGVVLFVQLVPIFLGADMEAERGKMLRAAPDPASRGIRGGGKLIDLDPIGLGIFSLTVILGILIGKVRVPLPGGAAFSLGNTGGALLTGLLFGHFGHAGPVNLRISEEFLKAFREVGLVMFLIGAGVPGGSGFLAILQQYGAVLFLYGALMELIPMALGFLAARCLVKLQLLDALGSITGGMTSTPALGALIHTAGTDDVASAYAATYPVALVLVVLISQLLVRVF